MIAQGEGHGATVGMTAHGAAHHGGESGITLGQHWVQSVPGVGTFHVDTVIYAGLVMLTLLAVFGVLARTLSPEPHEDPNGIGSVIELLVEFCLKIVRDFIGVDAKPYLWYIGSIFMFILASNWLALLPWKAWEIWIGHPLGVLLGAPHPLVYEAPTADLNMTLAMALVTLVLYWYFGVLHNGATGFLAHHWFAKPALLAPLRMLEDVTRPLSLALRLFANMTAGHVIGLVLLMLTYFVVPSLLLPLELFVGAIQAFVFAVLSASYIGTAVADHSHAH